MAIDLFLYLTKVSLGIAIVWLIYTLLLRNDVELFPKRLFLIGGILMSWIFPLLNLGWLSILSRVDNPISTSGTMVDDLLYYPGSDTPSASGTSWPLIVFSIYAFGVFLFLMRDLIEVTRLKKRWNPTVRDGVAVTFIDTNSAFTLFSRIFLPASLNNKPQLDIIILHERAHIRQMHFVDLLISELTIVLTWFNPFSWLISRMIKDNHEHLADREVLSNGINPAFYKAQLANLSLDGEFFAMVHQFNHSLTKNRFKMMKTTTSKIAVSARILFAIPVLIISLLLFTGGKASTQEGKIKGKVVLSETGKAASGASIVIEGTTKGATAGQNGEFSIDAEDGQVLVVSFVGYSTLKIKASEVGKSPIMLKQQSIVMDLPENKQKIIIRSAGIVQTEDGKNPLFLVDGNVVDDISGIDPAMIESVNVIKDTDSELVKKHNAVNGIVAITLKKKPSADVPTEKEIFIVVEEMPSFPGGKEALSEYLTLNLKRPDKAKKNRQSAEIMVEFTVLSSGKVSNAKVIKSTSSDLNEAALAVISGMPDWSPGLQRGKPVNVNVVIPVRFVPAKE